MKGRNYKRLLVIIIGFWAINSNAQECYWSSHAGGLYHDGNWVLGVDRLGCVYTNGSTDSHQCYFNSDTLYSGGSNLAFIVKYDNNGNEVWIKEFDGAGNSEDGFVSVVGVIDTIRNVIFVSGSFYGELSISDTNLYGTGMTIYIIKMDFNGNMIWARTAGGAGEDYSSGISIDENGNIYLSGQNSEPASFGNITIPPGGFLAKFNGDGDLIWAKNKFRYWMQYSSSPYTEAPPYQILYSGQKIFVNGSINNDTIIIDTIIKYPGAGNISSYIASFDTSGNIEWINFAGGPQGTRGLQFSADQYDNIFVTGDFMKTGIFGTDTLRNSSAVCDGFIAKYGIDGNLKWVKQVNATEWSHGKAVISDNNGGAYFSGTLSGTAQFGNDLLTSGSSNDMFLARYLTDGSCKGVIQYTKGELSHLAIDKNGNIILAGSFENTLTIGPNTFNSYGQDDLFVAKCSAITGIEEKTKSKQTQLVIYANPTTGKCNITIPDDFRNEKNLVLQIFDASGRMVQKTPVSITDQGKISVNISEEAKGVYNAILSNGKKNYSGKIVFN